ncbi:NIPSNAP family protein [Nocardia iowensis]|nr:NIPSNAP family protein [Nocardia iowensis]
MTISWSKWKRLPQSWIDDDATDRIVLAPDAATCGFGGRGRVVKLEPMITCVVEYVIDPAETAAFERFARRWMNLVDRHGGTHHGYFLPSEGASDKALALFSFPSLAAYEQYRSLFGTDPEFIAADRIRDESGCVLRHERTFMRPLLPDHD